VDDGLGLLHRHNFVAKVGRQERPSAASRDSQHVEGFDDRVEQMRTGSIEATFAEFDFGRFLYIHDIDFKFVTACGVAGKDYEDTIRGRP
jgi:hypothetical protein